jgi:thiosulfate/3-mercaptopyruvate sulfurtransferase
MYAHLRGAALAVALMSLAGGHTAAAQSGGSPSLLVTPQQLSRELSDPALVILQVGPKETYEAGHIPGARFITMQDVAAPRTPGVPPLELPDEAELRSRLEKLGISDGSRVVVVGDSDWVSPATRVVWTLQTAGLGARTRLLNGGASAWKRAGLAVTKEAPPAATPGKLTLAADRSVVVDNAWMQAHLKSPGIRVIDGRAPMFYEGVGMPEHNAKAGHIPGAKNIPFNSLTTDSLDMLPTAELRRIFAAAGVQPGDTVAAYCHIGQQATVVVFAARLLGIPVRLYDGSMNDWEARKLPLENEHPDKKQPPPDR